MLGDACEAIAFVSLQYFHSMRSLRFVEPECASLSSNWWWKGLGIRSGPVLRSTRFARS
jgi:hypothetical protein